jgi:hypothetical protein
MNKADLIKALEPFDDDIEINIVVNGTMWPAARKYIVDNNGNGRFLIIKDIFGVKGDR